MSLIKLRTAWYYRGIIHLYQGDTRTAVNDLVEAGNLDPLNFNYSVALGKALWADERLAQAILQFKNAELIAITDQQLAEVYYNRAQIYEQQSSMSKAKQDWELLLALPPDHVPEDWRTYAQEHLDLINPHTPSKTPTITPIPTQAESPTSTPLSNITPTPPESPL
jgi:tetratricopeptide (TPR) repeat protein